MIEMFPPIVQLQLKMLCSPPHIPDMCFDSYLLIGGGGDLSKINPVSIAISLFLRPIE